MTLTVPSLEFVTYTRVALAAMPVGRVPTGTDPVTVTGPVATALSACRRAAARNALACAAGAAGVELRPTGAIKPSEVAAATAASELAIARGAETG
ncbi:MAG: hypothetical protein ACR2KV_12995 [Solirubrobacteraceae bacterium]